MANYLHPIMFCPHCAHLEKKKVLRAAWCHQVTTEDLSIIFLRSPDTSTTLNKEQTDKDNQKE